MPASASGRVHPRSRSLSPSADIVLWVTLIAAFAARLYLALSSTYFWDEDHDWINTAVTISFNPAHLNLPLRADYHGALPAYLIRISALLFGETPAGFRFVNVVLGALTVAVVYALVREWKGEVAARWAAALMAVNEFHVSGSMLAIQRSPFLFFAAVSLYCCVRFLETERPRWLYWTAASAAFAFLSYEIALFLIPTFALGILGSATHRRWVARKEPYVAAAIFLVLVAPDLLWNALVGPSDRLQASYGNHLGRIEGLTLNGTYLLLYLRDAVNVAGQFLGTPFHDPAPEYPTMNAFFGVVLLSGVAWSTVRVMRLDAVGRLLLYAFWIVFGFFFFLKTGRSDDGVLGDSIGWWWVDLSLIPAIALTAALLTGERGWRQRTFRAVAVLGIVYAVANTSVRQLGLPAIALGLVPQALDREDGALVDVRAHLVPSTLLTGRTSLELLDVARQEQGGERSVLGTTEVVGAEAGTDDEVFAVRAMPGAAYRVTYRVRFPGGRTEDLTARLEHRTVDTRRDPFWGAAQSEGAAGVSR
jgi:4-amino-4-deoxy-L-arabinose transferase-like glycosyltransferase